MYVSGIQHVARVPHAARQVVGQLCGLRTTIVNYVYNNNNNNNKNNKIFITCNWVVTRWQ